MKPFRKFLIFSLLALVSMYYVLSNYTVLQKNPFNDHLSIDYPSNAVRDENGFSYIIDNSKRRITKISPNGKIQYIINGGDRSDGSFFYANDIAVDDNGNIYVLNMILDKYGFFTVKEQIVKYSPNGKFSKILYEQQYDHSTKPEPTHVQRGQLLGLSIDKDRIFFYDLKDNSVEVKSCLFDGSDFSKRPVFDYNSANLIIADISRVNAIEIVYSTKKGEIFRYNESFGQKLLFSGDDSNSDRLIIPWTVTADNNSVFFTDLGERSVKKITASGVKSIISQELLKENGREFGNLLYYSLSLNQKNVLTACSDGFVISINEEGKILNLITAGQYPATERVYSFSVWFVLLLIFVFIFLAFRVIYIHYMKRKFSPLLLKILAIIFIIIVAAVMVSNIIIKNFSTRYQNEIISKMSQLTQILPYVVETDRILEINSQEDFMNDDYSTVRKQLLKALNYNQDPWNNSIYFAMYRVIDEELYGFMFLNGYINAFHPFDYGYEEEDSVYRLAKQGQILAEIDSDSMGTWLYSVGPVRDSKGNVIAILEIGTDLYAFQQENRRLIINILLDVITMLAVFILLIVEFSFLGSIITYEMEKDQSPAALGMDDRRQTKFFDVNMARPLAFMYFTPVSMSLVFIPLMMKGFYKPVLGIPEKFIIALPISAEMLFFGIATIVSGGLINRYGWRKIFNLGMALTGLGLILSGISFEMYGFIAARAVFGLASGITLLSIRGFINIERREEERNVAFSNYYSGLIVGANVGAIIGAVLSDHIGYSNVFFFAFVILSIPMFFAWRYLADHEVVDRRSRITGLRLSASLKKFFTDKNVFLYTLLLIVPTYIAGTFLQYYFPLFAEEQGMNVANIGRVFLLNGLFIIYLGPVLTRFMEKHFGALTAAAFSSVLWGVSLFVAAYYLNIAGAIAAIVIMGITEGFGVSSQNSIFYKLKIVNEIGLDTSVGYFELVAKLAETVAPIIFAFALLLGPKYGLSAIGLGVIVSYIVFRFFAHGEIGSQMQNDGENKQNNAE